jgi:integrase
MESTKRGRGRPPRGYPYVQGPYRHRAQWRLVIVTGRIGGKRQSYYHKTQTREAALNWAREFQRQIATGGRTIQEAVDAYIDGLRRKGNKEGSIKTASYRLKALLDMSLSLVDLNAARAQQMYDDLVDEGVAADTHRGCLISGRAFGKFCVTKKWLRTNPFSSVTPVGRKSKGKEQLRVDEARVYMRHCFKAWAENKDRGAVAGLLALMFSMRASEVSQLVARDVDDRGRILRIAEHEAKTKASKRSAAVPPRLVPMLLELAACPATEEGHLFAKESGLPADRHWVLYHARRHMALAGVPVITAHGLRGTSATIGSTLTGGASVMADALGHESESMTKDAYIDPDAMSDATAARVAALLDDDDDV